MLRKRGQLTLFVITAVVVIIAVGLYFIFKENPIEQNSINNEKVIILRDNTLDCLDNLYLTSLVIVGFQGGYYEVSDGLYDGYTNIPYYYKQGSLNVPSLNVLEGEIEKFIDANIDDCIDYEKSIFASERLGITITEKDLVDDSLYGYQTSFNKKKIEVKILENEVNFISDIELVVEDPEGNSYLIKLKEYPRTIDSDLYSMREIADYYSTSLYEEDESVCISCIDQMSAEKNLSIEIVSLYTNEDELLTIYNDLTKQPFLFQVLNKYSEVEDYELTEFPES